MNELNQTKCKPCEGDSAPLKREQIQQLLSTCRDWTLNESGTCIHRNFTFKGFYKTMSFVNAIAWLANQDQHHPDMEVGYNYCNVKYTTHAIGGLSENDFICAAKVNRLID